MPNILFKLGSVDLSSYVRVNPQENLDLGQGDMLEPAFSDSPLFEGQILTSLHAKNKELKVPLYLHPSAAPYTQDALNQLVQLINQALRPVTDLGATLYAEWKNAQATNSTFFTVQFGRFEPNFNFRVTEKGWLAGILHLWVLPYAHTATERIVATYAAPANQSGLQVLPASMLAGAAAGTVVGDLSPQFDLRVQVGSYLGEDGRLGIIAALPIPSYSPIVPVASLVGFLYSFPTFVATVMGASGAWGSQYLALDGASPANVGATTSGGFRVLLSPASVYASGDNRVLGLVRARAKPYGLRAFDLSGNPLGPTVTASAMDGWQVVDYGTLRVPPWAATIGFTVQAYPSVDFSASGVFAPVRTPVQWTKEHGPVFVIPNGFSILDLDWNSPPLSIDGFDGAASAYIGQDMLGNSWFSQSGSAVYTGNSQLAVSPGWIGFIGSAVGLQQDWEVEAIVNIRANPSNAQPPQVTFGVAASAPVGSSIALPPGVLNVGASPAISFSGATQPLSGQFPVGVMHVKAVSRTLPAPYWNVYIAGASGLYTGSASGVALVASKQANSNPPNLNLAGAQLPNLYPAINVVPGSASIVLEAFRVRAIPSQGHAAQDILHLHQPLVRNTRTNTTNFTPPAEVVDLQARQRGPVQAPILPVPSLGAGLFLASFPWDQGPANDLLNVDIRIRERFTYAR